MSLPLPEDFHVETKKRPTCTNPACSRAISSETHFCPSCWGHLKAGTRDRIMRAQASRNKPGISISVRRAVTELKAKDAKRAQLNERKKDNAAFSNNPTMPSLDTRHSSDSGRPGHRPAAPRPERGVSQ